MKSIKDYINESIRIDEKKEPKWLHDVNNKCDDLNGAIDFKWLPMKHNAYNADSDINDYLGEIMGAVNEKPFSTIDKKVLRTFGIDPNGVEVYRYVVVDPTIYDVGDYEEVILYTPNGMNPEGEDHDFAVEDIFPDD